MNRSPTSATADDGSPIVGDPVTFFGPAVVAFIDLLGFRSAVMENWGDSSESALARILRIKDTPIVSQNIGFSFADCDLQGRARKTYRCRVSAVFDSVTIGVALPAAPSVQDLGFSLLTLLTNLRLILAAALVEGFAARGGIEFGSVFWTASDTTGPAFIEAYALESKRASYARVIVGPQLIRLLRECSERLADNWLVGKGVRGLLRVCADGLIAVDPRCLVGGSPEQRRDVVEQVKTLRERCADDSYRSAKYDWLLNVIENPSETNSPTLDDLRACESVLRGQCRPT